MKVYAAQWNYSCESGWDTLSLHTAKTGAWRALRNYRYNLWVERRNEQIERGEGKFGRQMTREHGLFEYYPATYDQDWQIKEFRIED